MPAYRKLLVADDFSRHAQAALDLAIDWAVALGARLDLVHVYHAPVEILSPYAIKMPAGLEADVRKSAGAKLAERRKRASAAGIEGEDHLREGVPAHEIAQTAREVEADLIVLGTHGHTGLAHVLLGSVAERTLRAADCSVLTVKAAAG